MSERSELDGGSWRSQRSLPRGPPQRWAATPFLVLFVVGNACRSGLSGRGSVPRARVRRRADESGEVLDIAAPISIGRIGDKKVAQLAERGAASRHDSGDPAAPTDHGERLARCSTASSTSANRLDASVAEISIIN
jgi:hypothetical protein